MVIVSSQALLQAVEKSEIIEQDLIESKDLTKAIAYIQR